MAPTHRTLYWPAGAVLLTGLALVALAPWDLAISLALAEYRGGAFGAFVQAWGTKPASALIVLGSFVLASRPARESHPLAARASAAMAVHLLLQPALLTNGLKLLTGRPRPVHLGALGEGFAPFHAIAPGFGDFSFPSGHVAVTMILAPVVLVLWREGSRRLAGLVALAACLWTGTVAFGRVAFGAHFPTDVLCSLGLGVALAPVSVLLGQRFVGWLAGRARGQ